MHSLPLENGDGVLPVEELGSEQAAPHTCPQQIFTEEGQGSSPRGLQPRELPERLSS